MGAVTRLAPDARPSYVRPVEAGYLVLALMRDSPLGELLFSDGTKVPNGNSCILEIEMLYY